MLQRLFKYLLEGISESIEFCQYVFVFLGLMISIIIFILLLIDLLMICNRCVIALKIAFGSPYFCQEIPYRKIYKVSVVILLAYSYIKYVLWLYRYGKQKINNFNKRRILKQISKSIIGSERIFKIIRIRSLVNSSYIF